MRLFSTLLQSSTYLHRRLLSLRSTDSLKDFIVSPEDIQTYKRDGVVCLRGVLSPTQCAEIAAFMSKTVTTFEKFTKQSQLPSIAAQLMNNIKMVRFFYDQLFIKAAGTQARTAWHNDLSYWPFRGNDLISLWCALTPVKQESSGMEYVPGTHLNNTLYQAITTDEDEKFIDPSRAACPDFSNDPRVVSWNMEAGDVVCHHPLTIHGSGANNALSGPTNRFIITLSWRRCTLASIEVCHADSTRCTPTGSWTISSR